MNKDHDEFRPKKLGSTVHNLAENDYGCNYFSTTGKIQNLRDLLGQQFCFKYNLWLFFLNFFKRIRFTLSSKFEISKEESEKIAEYLHSTKSAPRIGPPEGRQTGQSQRHIW